MHPAMIKAHIQIAGHTQESIARSLDPPVSDVAVNHVIAGRSSSRRIAERIAEVTGKTLDELWPGRYPPLPDDTA